MSEYKSRRERRHAQGGKIGAGHPTANKGPALVIALIKKKKDGGHVEGEKARHHLGKRARGGRLIDTEHKALNAREAAFDSDGIDKEAIGSGKDEREVPVEKRAGGGATQKAKYDVDDDSSKDMGDLDTPKRGSKNEYTTDDDDKRAKGSWIATAREHMERKGTVGSLHKAMHVPEGEKIPEKRLESAAKHAGPKLAKKIQFAENVRK